MSKTNLGSTQEFAELEYTIDGKDYILRQAPTKLVTKWKNFTVSSARLVIDPKTNQRLITSGDVAASEPLLVSYCLFLLQDNNGQRSLIPVGLNFIENWPYPIIERLFEDAKKLCKIKTEEDEDTIESLQDRIARDREKLDKLLAGESEAKNSQLNTTDNSE